MAHHEEPMDVDCIDSDFDNKENTYHHSNVLPCTEKGYEELDVSELNMKLRYSITPAASPMSKSYTAYVDNRNLDTEDSLNCTNENDILTRSLNSTITKNDSVIKSLKNLPLQTISTDQFVDNRGSVLKQLDSTITPNDNNVTVAITEANDINENLSLPSSSSSATHTPEANSPTNITKTEEGSPIIRGLKSVFNMFRSSQSPIPPVENETQMKQERPLDETYCEDPNPQTLASTPISAHKSRDGSSKRASPLKDSIVFSDDLEKELQWKDDTILFSEERIPIHKLFLPHNKPTHIATGVPQEDQKPVENLDTTVEYMDISQNNSAMDNTLTETHNTNAVESDGEFVDCETTFSKNESQYIARNDETLSDPIPNTLQVFDVTKGIVNEVEPKVNESLEKTVNEIQNKLTNTPQQTLDITSNIVSTKHETGESADKINQHLPLSCTISNNTPKDIMIIDSVENGEISSNIEIQGEPSGAVNTLDTTKETVNENVSDMNLGNLGSTDIEIQKEPLPNTLIKFDVTMEIKDEKAPELDLPENAITPDRDTVSLAKSIEISAEVSLDQKEDNVLQNVNQPNIEDESVQEEKQINESIVIENFHVSNNINQGEVIFEISREEANPETDINITQLTESIKTIVYPEITALENTSNIKSSQNNNTDLKNIEDIDASSEQKLVACAPGDSINKVINELLVSKTESNITVKKQVQLPNDLDATYTSAETLANPQNLVTEEPENIPLPDFDTALELNNDKVQTMSPDVLKTLKTESKLDVLETLNKILDDTHIIETVTEEHKGQPTSEVENVLNETNDIVNSLTEIIGESLNSTITEPNIVIDQSQNNQMEGIVCTDEIHVLPDLVNQTIHNMSVVCENTPELVNQSQNELDSGAVAVLPSFSNVPETIPNVINENKSTSVSEITKEQSNESINENKEYADTTVATESIDVLPEINLGDLKSLEAENILKENKALDVDFIPNVEVSGVPTVDEELVLSENNSPYVSVIAETELKPTEESFEKNDIPLNTTGNAPPSPPIRSKGYNFNFDEMDDPFATKTKMKLLPPTPNKPIEHDDGEKIKSKVSKKIVPNRRKSQPPERKRPVLNKKKFNTTIDAGSFDKSSSSLTNDQNSEGDSEVNHNIKNTTLTMNLDNEVDKEVATILESTQVLDKFVEENFNTSENDLSNVQSNEKDTLAVNITFEISAESKSSIESLSTAISEVKTSSSEHSTYYSAAASSSDSSISKNVFNLPEIDDKNFNPFATKSKMRQSPSLGFENENPFATKSKMRSSPISSSVIVPSVDNTQVLPQDVKNAVEDKVDVELMEKDSSYNLSNNTSSSSKSDDKNITTRQVYTEDEDTEEGPFLEPEVIDKLLGMENDDMMQFNEIPVQATDENADSGELFIDAEAFEFLLNQNKSNVVADSGKESLFLKFDPLFAKRISSDGVLAALNNVQKRQSTPTKQTRPTLTNEASPIAGSSTFNVTYDEETNVTQDSVDDLNITVAKPMMVVTPAVNPAATPRNRTTTPPRSNRRSITFTSPAMAVIDRLLSLSGHNNSILGQDNTITQANREHIEADLALTQLRELLAEKEISVYQLRSESKELKDRLSTMETQVKILEADGQERLNKINELSDRLAEKTKVNKSMAAVVEEYERTIASLIAETEQDKKRHAEERIRLINERDEQTAHLASMEVSFSDLHSKYEKSKQVILSCKANEETCKKSIKAFEENLTKMQTNYEMLKQHATSKLNHANQELQKMNKTHESEVLKMNAMIKRKEMHITSLEETLAQKTKANEELTAICDELINKVG